MPDAGEIDYSSVVKLDLGSVTPSLAGPKRPQDRVELGQMARNFAELLTKSTAENGFNQPAASLTRRHPVTGSGANACLIRPPLPQGAPRDVAEMVSNRPTMRAAPEGADMAPADADPGTLTLGHGDILIAAITSCTNPSNPSVLLAAGLLAKKAVKAGLQGQPHIKTSLAPGSRIVTEYLEKAGLLTYLEKLGFAVAAYGCTTCIGNAGDLTPELNETIVQNDLVCAAVLSGNRNFEARIHPNLKANFLPARPWSSPTRLPARSPAI